MKVGCLGSENPPPSQRARRMRHPKAAHVGLVGLILLVGANSSVFAQESYRVAGIAVNDGDGTPLGRTRVSLSAVQDRRNGESVITGADGRFEFRNVPAGKFSLGGARRNFMPTTYQWHDGYSTAIVTGAGLDTENLVLRLIPLGIIAGKVVDEAGERARRIGEASGRPRRDATAGGGEGIVEDERRAITPPAAGEGEGTGGRRKASGSRSEQGRHRGQGGGEGATAEEGRD